MKQKVLSILYRLYDSKAQMHACGEFFHKLAVGAICGGGYILLFMSQKTVDDIVIAVFLFIIGIALCLYGRSFFQGRPK